MDSTILWAASFTLYKLGTKNLHLATRIIFSSCLPKGDTRIFSISIPAQTIKITPKVVLWMSEVLVNHEISSKNSYMTTWYDLIVSYTSVLTTFHWLKFFKKQRITHNFFSAMKLNCEIRRKHDSFATSSGKKKQQNKTYMRKNITFLLSWQTDRPTSIKNTCKT